ncbi:hypothetical protein [Nannocystis pusilla]|uniref:hypothetical protein n=1 Tax=Nannocystis pusilla TaxID=889268 RepID=UPI003B82499B
MGLACARPRRHQRRRGRRRRAHSCARVQGGKVMCWGTGSHGQLGDRGNARAPVRSPGSTACRRWPPARATPARSRQAAARCAGAPASARTRSTSPASPEPWP